MKGLLGIYQSHYPQMKCLYSSGCQQVVCFEGRLSAELVLKYFLPEATVCLDSKQMGICPLS